MSYPNWNTEVFSMNPAHAIFMRQHWTTDGQSCDIEDVGASRRSTVPTSSLFTEAWYTLLVQLKLEFINFISNVMKNLSFYLNSQSLCSRVYDVTLLLLWIVTTILF